MDFQTFKKNYGYPIADGRNPRMGLNGVVCKDPVYWCRLHEVWLSEEDVARKQCRAKPTHDMLGAFRCKCLEQKTPPK